MEEELEVKTPFQAALNNGLILGVIHSIVYLVLYFFIPSKTTGFSYLFFVIALNIGYSIFQGVKYRKSIGGYLEYGKAFQLLFLTLLANGVISSLVIPLIIRFADSSFVDVMAQSQYETSYYWAQKMGAPEASLEQMPDVEKLKESYTLAKSFIGFGVAILFYALTASILAFIVRKSEPLE